MKTRFNNIPRLGLCAALAVLLISVSACGSGSGGTKGSSEPTPFQTMAKTPISTPNPDDPTPTPAPDAANDAADIDPAAYGDQSGNLFRYGLLCVKTDDGYGYINSAGDMVINAQFYEAQPFINGYAGVRRSSGKWGYVNTENQYLEIEAAYGLPFGSDGTAAVRDESGKWGFIDTMGEYIITPRFDDVFSPFYFGDTSRTLPYADDFAYFAHNGLAPAKNDGKWGYVSKTGDYAIEPGFAVAFPFTGGKDLAAVCVSDKWGYIDAAGDFIFRPIFEQCGMFAKGSTLAAVRDNGLWGFVDASGTFPVRPQFQSVDNRVLTEPFAEGFEVVLLDNFYGYVNKAGKFTIGPCFAAASEFSGGMAFVMENAAGGTKKGYVNTDGMYAIESLPEGDIEISGFGAAGIAAMYDPSAEDVKFIDKTGAVLRAEPSGLTYSSEENGWVYRFFDDGYCVVSTGNFYGVINKDGTYAVTPVYKGVGASVKSK